MAIFWVVDACLWAAREKPFRSLTPREATLVELEVTFYLAYALMAVGELERAKMCFESFAEVSGRLKLFEARDHARLFLVKLGLKRKPLLAHQEHELDKAYFELRSLSFRAALSLPVGGECLRYELIVKLLASLARARKRSEIAPHVLADLGHAAETLLTELCEFRRTLLEGVLVGVGPEDRFAELVHSAINEIGRRLRRVSKITIEPFQSESLTDVNRRQSKYSFRLWFGDSWRVETNAAISMETIPAILSAESCMGFPTYAEAIDILVVGIAVIAIKRVWTDDQYVFGMVPCLESPATKFQHPTFDVRSIL